MHRFKKQVLALVSTVVLGLVALNAHAGVWWDNGGTFDSFFDDGSINIDDPAKVVGENFRLKPGAPVEFLYVTLEVSENVILDSLDVQFFDADTPVDVNGTLYGLPGAALTPVFDVLGLGLVTDQQFIRTSSFGAPVIDFEIDLRPLNIDFLDLFGPGGVVWWTLGASATLVDTQGTPAGLQNVFWVATDHSNTSPLEPSTPDQATAPFAARTAPSVIVDGVSVTANATGFVPLVDDYAFRVASVPLPGTALLVLAGFAGFRLRQRRLSA